MALILVIDDDAEIRKMLRIMLEREGYEVEDAQDGDVGLTMYRERPSDLVITDIVMPEKEGIETIRTLKRENPHVKIIAMSGGGRIMPDSYLKLAKSLGADVTFTKPIEKKKLVQAIKDLLGESPAA